MRLKTFSINNFILILVSLAVGILAFGLSYFVINHYVSSSVSEADYYQTMNKVNKDNFDYFLKTGAGKSGVERAKISVNDPVTMPELKGKFSYIERDEEEYLPHTETYTDSKGHTHSRIVWSWKHTGSNVVRSKEYLINDSKTESVIDMIKKDFNVTDKDVNKVESKGVFFKHSSYTENGYYYKDGETRFSYTTEPIKNTLTALVKLKQNKIYPLNGSSISTTKRSVKQIKKQYNNSADVAQKLMILAPIIGLLASIVTAIVFYKMEN